MTNKTLLPGLPDFDSPTLEEEMEAIAAKDKEIRAELLPFLDQLSWIEKMALGQTAYWFIAISAEHSLLKLIPAYGDGSFSQPLQKAMQLVENLSPQSLAELATEILEQDLEPIECDARYL